MVKEQFVLNLLHYSKIQAEKYKAYFRVAVLAFILTLMVNTNIFAMISFFSLFCGGIIVLASFSIFIKNENKLFAKFLKENPKPPQDCYEGFAASHKASRKQWLKKGCMWFLVLFVIITLVTSLDMNHQKTTLYDYVGLVSFSACVATVVFTFPYEVKMLDFSKKKV